MLCLWLHDLLYYTVAKATVLEFMSTCVNPLFSEYFDKFARYVLQTNIMYLNASADVKILTFLEKNEGWG